MDKLLTDFLVKERRIGKLRLAPLDLLLLVGMTVSGVMLRISVGDYTPVPGDYLAYEDGLKVIGCLFGWALAALLAALVFRLTNNRLRTLLAYSITFVLPVFVSADVMWGMGDSIYLFFLLLAFGLLLIGRTELSLGLYGISVFLNAYALFLLPLYLLVWLQGKVKPCGFLSPIAACALHIIAERKLDFAPFEAERLLLAGRMERLLSYNCPNVFALIGPDKFVSEYETVALCFSLGFVLILLTVLPIKKLAAGIDQIFEIALLLVLFLPYTLPGMDERSLLPACVISLLYGFVRLRRFFLPIVLTTITYISYSAYFREESPVPLPAVSLVLLALIVYLCWRLTLPFSTRPVHKPPQ